MAIADAPTPVPGRASDADRERFVKLLQERSIEGRLSTDTFARRLERVLGARSLAELDALVADVRPPGGARRALMRAVSWLSALSADLQAAWRGPRLPVLALPTDSTTIGRSTDCDCLLTHPSVSRRHAELRRTGEHWRLRDLGSRNGTRLNGIRVTEEVEARPGDQVSFGGMRFTLRERR
jgi:FHA domain-containing protein/uncharacterized protein DUF1707